MMIHNFQEHTTQFGNFQIAFKWLWCVYRERGVHERNRLMHTFVAFGFGNLASACTSSCLRSLISSFGNFPVNDCTVVVL